MRSLSRPRCPSCSTRSRRTRWSTSPCPRLTGPSARPALRRGLPVLCEKPLAETVAVGLSMAAAADLTGRLLMVSQSRRYWRHLDTLRGLLGQLGPIGTVDCSFRKAPRFGGFREVMPYPLLVDMAIHQFDLSRLLIDADPVAVYCDSYNPSWSWFAGDAAADVLFEFADGDPLLLLGQLVRAGAGDLVERQLVGQRRRAAAAAWDGDNAPTAEDADGHRAARLDRHRPEQIAGSFAEFAAAVRSGDGAIRPARCTATCSAWPWSRRRSGRAEQRTPGEIAEILDDAYAKASGTEAAADLSGRAAGWPSVHDVVGEPRPRLRHMAVADGMSRRRAMTQTGTCGWA